MSGFRCRAESTEYTDPHILTPDTRHPTSDIRHPTPDTRHPTSDTRHPTPDTRHPTSDTRHSTPDIRHLTPDSRPMNWTNVKLIWAREVRDQLRDRRTIFTIAVLPLLLYPLLGMTFLQITQFMKEHQTRVWLIGSAALPEDPPLLDGDHFSEGFCLPEEARLLDMTFVDSMPDRFDTVEPRHVAQREIRSGHFDAVVYFPPNFAERLAQFRSQLESRAGGSHPPALDLQLQVPQPEIFVNLASDKSRMAYDRVDRVLDRWRREIIHQNLRTSNVPVAATEPFEVAETDVSEEETRRAAVWSKVLPFIVLIWALTGAFYPAIDLCAGEKERGTLETLLTSPARRSEIVWGKLLTVIVFSVATALLNLISMGITGAFIMQQIERMTDVGLGVDLGPPSLAAIGWLLLATVPIAALFSALALAIAAFARSSKEGQYYLMPLLLITLPLMTLPMLPTVELELGTSVIPVTGMMLWLRALIEGEYVEAARYAMPVLGVTMGCCLLAIRWAVRQFEDETVLFRESERFGLGLWVRQMVRDRGETPSVTEALMCGVLLLLVTFFASLRAVPPDTWLTFVKTVLITQIALIAGPVLIMAAILTRSARATLLLRVPRPMSVPAALLLAVALHPLVVLLGHGIQALYPMGEETLQALAPLMTAMREAPLLSVILVIALVPAVCEELAFRGFILSGLRHTGSKWGAIVISSVFFGLTHGLLQQSLAAIPVGIVIGYIAVQTGSLVPGMVFHFTHNSVSLLSGRVTAELVGQYPLLGLLYQPTDSYVLTYTYHGPLVLVSGAMALALLLWFRRLPYARYTEEELQETLHHQTPPATAEA